MIRGGGPAFNIHEKQHSLPSECLNVLHWFYKPAVTVTWLPSQALDSEPPVKEGFKQHLHLALAFTPTHTCSLAESSKWAFGYSDSRKGREAFWETDIRTRHCSAGKQTTSGHFETTALSLSLTLESVPTSLYFCCAQSLSCIQLFCWPMGLFVHGISQARKLEWGAISSSRESSWPRGRTWVSSISCIAGRLFTAEPYLLGDNKNA